MSFNDEIKKPASDKFYMVRVQGGKLFTSLNTTHVASVFDAVLGAYFQVYEAYIQKHLSIKDFNCNVDRNGSDSAFTKVNEWTAIKVGGSAPYYQTYSYDPETGYIKFSTPLLSNTSSIQDDETLILEYYLFFTSFVGRRAPLDMASGEEVFWTPRLPKDFSIGFSQSNTLNGQLSVSSSSLALKNEDLYMNGFFGIHDSFNNREVKIWRCIDEVTVSQFEFSGVIRGASLDDRSCTFELNDILSVLDLTHYAGFTSYKYYSDIADSSDYIIRGDDQARPIYRLLGKTGPYDVFYYNTQSFLQVRLLDPAKMLPATCISYDGVTKTTSTNRKWSCGFGPSTAANVTLTCSSVGTRILDDYHDSYLNMTSDPEEVLAVGDTFKLGSQYGIVIGLTDTRIYSWPENVSFAAGTVTRVKCPAVVVTNEDGTKFYPKGIKDYTCAIGPKGDLQITFVNNFEAGYAGIGTLDPDTHEVHVRYWNDDYDSKASSIVKSVLQASGLSCATAFVPDQTPAWPDPRLAFTVPFFGEGSFPAAFDVIEQCLRSALSFIYLDNEGSFRYKSFLDGIQAISTDIENQSGQDPEDAINQSNSSSFSINFDLYDQYIGTRFDLTHAPQSTNWNSYFGSYSFSGPGAAQERLYKSNKMAVIETVIDPHNNQGLSSDNFFDLYNELMTGRKAEYSLKVFSRHFRLYIGDDILVSRAKLTGEDSEAYMRVISASKASNELDLKFLDLKRFPK
jgi:hypothetical protein